MSRSRDQCVQSVRFVVNRMLRLSLVSFMQRLDLALEVQWQTLSVHSFSWPLQRLIICICLVRSKAARNWLRRPSQILAPQVGLEPTTLRLTAECSAIELLRNEWRLHCARIRAEQE